MNEQWVRRAMHHVAKAKGRKFPVTDKDFDRLASTMTADDALYVNWVGKNQKIPAGCLVRICADGNCCNPDHAEEQP